MESRKCDIEAELAAHCLMAMSNSKNSARRVPFLHSTSLNSSDRQSPLSSESSHITFRTGSSAGTGVVDFSNNHPKAESVHIETSTYVTMKDKTDVTTIEKTPTTSEAHADQFGNESLYMIARILTDLNSIKQDPVPHSNDECTNNNSKLPVSYSSVQTSNAQLRPSGAATISLRTSDTRPSPKNSRKRSDNKKAAFSSTKSGTYSASNSELNAIEDGGAKKMHHCSFAG